MQWLLESASAKLRSAIMQVPHHGIKNSLSHLAHLVEKVQPRYGLLNAGVGGDDISDEVLEVYRKAGVEILSSYDQGAVTLKLRNHR
jgi:beta-lactamase superfamily II metal-dependent hydrolase